VNSGGWVEAANRHGTTIPSASGVK
jgi:hypothetical protein